MQFKTLALLQTGLFLGIGNWKGGEGEYKNEKC